VAPAAIWTVTGGVQSELVVGLDVKVMRAESKSGQLVAAIELGGRRFEPFGPAPAETDAPTIGGAIA